MNALDLPLRSRKALQLSVQQPGAVLVLRAPLITQLNGLRPGKLENDLLLAAADCVLAQLLLVQVSSEMACHDERNN